MSWPRLSETLPGPRSPDSCQACGARWVDLVRWYECDDTDAATRVVVVTCKPCERRVITPHPRLYRQLAPDEHNPGSMPLCELCRQRDGLTCRAAKLNGGPGIVVTPVPSRVMVKASRKSLSGLHVLWRPATGCTGRQVLAIAGGCHDGA